MFRLAIPLLRVRSSLEAEQFYCGKLGFRRQFAYRLDEEKADPCYLGLTRDDAWLHLSSFSGDGAFRGVAYFFVDDVDALHAELASGGVRIDLEPTNQTWGNREMYVRDPDGNSLRFGQMAGGEPETNQDLRPDLRG